MLDPLTALALTLLLWLAGIAYIVHMAALEKRGFLVPAKRRPD